MKENAIRKINRFGKVTAILAKVAKILCFVAAGAILIGIIAVACMPNDMVKVTVRGNAFASFNVERFGSIPESSQGKIEEQIAGGNSAVDINGVQYGITKVEVGDTTIDVEATSPGYTFYLHDIIPLMLTGLFTVLVTISTIIFVERFCKSLKDCATPFEDNVLKKMRALAFAMIPWLILGPFNSGLVSGYYNHSVSFSGGFNVGTVIVVLVILALTFIFKYGAMLQKESDETL